MEATGWVMAAGLFALSGAILWGTVPALLLPRGWRLDLYEFPEAPGESDPGSPPGG